MSRRKWLWLALWILWTGVIFWNSAQNATVSDGLSDGVIELFGLPLSAFWVRKSAHFGAFALLGIWVTGFFAEGKKLRFVPFMTVLLVCLLTACADETIQLFPMGRSSELRDVWIDFAGAASGEGAFLLCKLVRNRLQGRRK